MYNVLICISTTFLAKPTNAPSECVLHAILAKRIQEHERSGNSEGEGRYLPKTQTTISNWKKSLTGAWRIFLSGKAPALRNLYGDNHVHVKHIFFVRLAHALPCSHVGNTWKYHEAKLDWKNHNNVLHWSVYDFSGDEMGGFQSHCIVLPGYLRPSLLLLRPPNERFFKTQLFETNENFERDPSNVHLSSSK